MSPPSSVYVQFKTIDASSKVSILVVSLLPSTLTVKPELSVEKKIFHLYSSIQEEKQPIILYSYKSEEYYFLSNLCFITKDFKEHKRQMK